LTCEKHNKPPRVVLNNNFMSVTSLNRIIFALHFQYEYVRKFEKIKFIPPEKRTHPNNLATANYFIPVEMRKNLGIVPLRKQNYVDFEVKII